MQRTMINFKEAVEKYGFKPWGLRWMVRKRLIPFVKIGRRIYFIVEKVDLWLEKHSVDVELEPGN